MPSIPQSVIDRDHELDSRSHRASELLAKHRWQQCLDLRGPRYPMREYARAVGRSVKVVSTYARGYALFVERQTVPPGRNSLSIQDAIRLADQSAEKQAFSEAIAEGSGKSVGQVARGDQRHRTGATIERAKARAERRGTDPVDEARNIAAEERKVAEARKARKEEDRRRRSIRFVHIEGHLATAQRRLLDALKEAEGVGFSDEEMELIRSSLANVRAVLDLIDARMAGTPDIDWDAEMARLTGERQ